MRGPAERVVAITGGGRGIGKALVERFTASGFRVGYCGRNDEDLSSVRSSLAAKDQERVLPWRADVRGRSSVVEFLEQTARAFGPIDVLVHNAGVGRFGSVESMTDEHWREVIDIDLTGSFHVLQEGFRRMLTNGGSPRGYVMTIGSLGHRLSIPGSVAYASAKAAQKVLSDYLFEEARHRDVLATYLAIGSVNTGFSSRTPDTGWKIQPWEVADMAVQLTDLAFRLPHLCLSYAELRVRHPLPTQGSKE